MELLNQNVKIISAANLLSRLMFNFDSNLLIPVNKETLPYSANKDIEILLDFSFSRFQMLRKTEN